MLQGFPGEFPLRGNGFLVGSALSIEGAAQYELDIPQSRKRRFGKRHWLFERLTPLLFELELGKDMRNFEEKILELTCHFKKGATPGAL